MRLCVFLGSSMGLSPLHEGSARAFGDLVARSGIGLVYGGGRVGLMGAVADAALAAGGEVTGIIPEALRERELDHRGLTRLEVVGSMHERKARMAELADGFVALPGGIGTYEELFEVWTWGQLGYHRKPCAVLNADGFYDKLIGFLDHVQAEGFLHDGTREMLIVERDEKALLRRIVAYEPSATPRWVERGNL